MRARLWLLPADHRGSLASTSLTLGLKYGVTCVFSVDHACRHIVVTVASYSILGARAAKNTDNCGLLGLARILQLLLLDLFVRQRLYGAAAPELGCFDCRDFLLGGSGRVCAVRLCTRAELV